MLKKRFWTTKNIIFTVLVIVLLLMLPKTIGILMLFFGAYVIACALNPYVSKLMKKMKNRTVAASVVLFSSIAAIIAVIKYKPKTNSEELYKLEKIDEDIK